MANKENATSERFRFKKGDRVDFVFDQTLVNNTPGTIRNRVHGKGEPQYVVIWDDGNTDNATYCEFELKPLWQTIS